MGIWPQQLLRQRDPAGARLPTAGVGGKGGLAVLVITHWVRGLVALVLLATVTEMLLPSGTLKGYARSLLGLLVLLGVLQPVVGLVKGDIHLDLPALVAPLRAAPPDQTAAAASAAATAYEQLVAGQTARMAQQVPGVRAASATLRFEAAAAGEPAVRGASVEVSPSDAWAAAGPDLTGRVRTAVAAGLGLSPAEVTVTIW